MSAPARFADAQDTDEPGRRRSSPNGSAFRPALSRSRSSICFRWSWPISGDSFRGGGAEKHLGWKVAARGPEFERNARADTRGAGAAPVAVLEGRQGRAALHDERRGHRRGKVTGTRRARPASRVETALGKKTGVRALSERLRARRAEGAVLGRSEATRAGGASRRGRPAGRAAWLVIIDVRPALVEVSRRPGLAVKQDFGALIMSLNALRQIWSADTCRSPGATGLKYLAGARPDICLATPVEKNQDGSRVPGVRRAPKPTATRPRLGAC